ncbi:substrate-binding domain-containing protein [Pseudahrensia aquimaris]|uniref:Substrate-binding domain-containing protein n=1 Tax=Pseudahrensia aquimaris TaxID=744461 RepID=A0ABW3FFA3_9HYPH
MKALVMASIVLSLATAAVEARPIQVVGTGDGMELVRALGAAFTSDNPDTVILVPPSIGSGGGIAAVGGRKAPLARVARPLKPTEEASGLVARAMFRLPSAIYTHPDLAIESLSHEQLIGIYSGAVNNWAALGGPDLRIKVVRREDTDSTLAVLRRSMPGWDDLELTTRSKIAVTTQDSVESVKSTLGAIGFGPFSRVLEESVNVLKIEGLHPTDQGYFSAVTVSYVWRRDDLRDDAKAFVDYGQSPKAQALLSALGAVPIAGDDADATGTVAQ